MKFVYNDGGRAAAGYKGNAGDCVVRSIAIATGKPYQEVYDELFELNRAAQKTQRNPKRSRSGRKRSASPRDGGTSKKTVRAYLESIGWRWVPTMGIGTGCTVHLHDGELPAGRLIVSVSGHMVAVIDGEIHDTYDPQRELHCIERDTGRELRPGEWRNVNGICSVRRRCVYGYFVEGGAQ